MKLYMTGVSAAAIAVAMAGSAAAQQDEGGGQQPGGERSAAEFTCDDLSKMDTARLPGALYFIAGHHVGATEGEGGGGDSGQQATAGPTGEESESEPQTVQLRGFLEIPIEGTIIACAENPDALVIDVITEQSEGGSAAEGEETEEGTAPAATPAEEDAASGEAAGNAPADRAEGAPDDAGNGETGDADIEAGGAEGVSTTREPGGVRGGETVSPEEAAEDDAEAPGAGGTNN